MTYQMLPELKTCERGHLSSNRFPFMKNVVFIGQENTEACTTRRNYYCWAAWSTTANQPNSKNRSTVTMWSICSTHRVPQVFPKGLCYRTITLQTTVILQESTWSLLLKTSSAAVFLFFIVSSGIGHHELPHARVHAGYGGTIRSALGTSFYSQRKVYRSLWRTYHVYSRATSPHV